MTLKARDSFAGAGGWDEGARLLGWHVEGNENTPIVIETRDAAGHITTAKDVRDVWPTEADVHAEIASPPCTTFSVNGGNAGNRALSIVLDHAPLYRSGADVYPQLAAATDPITALVLEPLRLVLASRAVYVAWEQVVSVRPIWEACAKVLRAEGWSAVVGIVNAEQFGVPQTRRRAVLLARRDGHAARMPSPSRLKFSAAGYDGLPLLPPPLSMGEALRWNGPGPGDWAMRSACGHLTGEWVQRSSNSASTKGGLVTAAERGRTMRRLDQPSTTITGRTFQWERSDGERKTCKLSQMSQIQTFTADYPWQGNITQVKQQIGNSVPPLLARELLHTVTH